MKHTTEQGRSAQISDSRYQDIGNLPSNFVSYSFKSLYVRPLTVLELRLISKAAVLKEPQHLLRAIDLVISEDIDQITIGDFYYLLMWLRIHSMPKTPYVIEWHCEEKSPMDADGKRIRYDDPEFESLLSAGPVTYSPCLTHNSEIIHLTDVEIVSVPDDLEGLPDPQIPGTALDWPRVRDLAAIQEAFQDPELRLIIGPAQWVAGTSLAEKISILEQQPDLALFDFASSVNEQVVHGIRETTTLTCRGCGIKRPHTLALDALSFFR